MSVSGSIDSILLSFRHLDSLATGDSVIHRLDARSKVIATLLFILAVVSLDRYALSALLPFFIFPVVIVSLAGLPARTIVSKVSVVLPLALIIGLFNPFFDRQTLLQLGSLSVSGGWVSYASIVLRFMLTVSAAVILVATTGFSPMCAALGRLGVPKPFVVQLLLLHRYLCVLTEEAARLSMARELRALGRPLDMRVFMTLIGHLLLRAWARAERIYLAMLARGFNGEMPAGKTAPWGCSEWLALAAWCAMLITLRLVDLPTRLGQWILGA